MKKRAVVSLIIFALLAPVLMSVPTASAKTLKFNEILNPPGWIYPDQWYPNMPGVQPQDRAADWAGYLTGDILATCYFWETDNNFVTGAKGGKVEHFFEDFLIVFSDGGWVVGRESQGIFTFKNLPQFDSAKYHAEGPITSASLDKQSFVGRKFVEEGIVTFIDGVGVGGGFIGP